MYEGAKIDEFAFGGADNSQYALIGCKVKGEPTKMKLLITIVI